MYLNIAGTPGGACGGPGDAPVAAAVRDGRGGPDRARVGHGRPQAGTHACSRARTRTRTPTHAPTHARTHTDARTYTHARTHAHAHAHAQTHARARHTLGAVDARQQLLYLSLGGVYIQSLFLLPTPPHIKREG